MKKALLKGLLESLPESPDSKMYTKTRARSYINGYHHALDDIRTALKECVEGLEVGLDWYKMSKIISLTTQDEAIQYRDGLTRCNVPLEKTHRALATIHDFIASRTITTKITDALASHAEELVTVKK